MRPLVGCMIHGSLWWLPSISYHQGGTMKTLATVIASSLVTLIAIVIAFIFFTAPQRIGDTASTPSTATPYPTWTNTPVPAHTSTPSPTNTPIPTATLPPQSQNWNDLVASSHVIPRDDLMRYHKDYIDKYVYFEGFAIQVLGDENALFVLMTVVEGEDFREDVYLAYKSPPIRVMKYDWIELVGRSAGLYTYNSVGAGPITLPLIEVVQLKIVDE